MNTRWTLPWRRDEDDFVGEFDAEFERFVHAGEPDTGTRTLASDSLQARHARRAVDPAVPAAEPEGTSRYTDATAHTATHAPDTSAVTPVATARYDASVVDRAPKADPQADAHAAAVRSAEQHAAHVAELRALVAQSSARERDARRIADEAASRAAEAATRAAAALAELFEHREQMRAAEQRAGVTEAPLRQHLTPVPQLVSQVVRTATLVHRLYPRPQLLPPRVPSYG